MREFMASQRRYLWLLQLAALLVAVVCLCLACVALRASTALGAVAGLVYFPRGIICTRGLIGTHAKSALMSITGVAMNDVLHAEVAVK